jgi:hypothetical protein
MEPADETTEVGSELVDVWGSSREYFKWKNTNCDVCKKEDCSVRESVEFALVTDGKISENSAALIVKNGAVCEICEQKQ